MKNKKSFLLMVLAIVCAVCMATFTACRVRDDSDADPETPHSHTLVKHDAVESTCTVQGTEEYWQCSGCNLYFSDENGATQIETPVKSELKEHSFTVWKYDETRHWHQCESCDNTDTPQNHTEAGKLVVICAEQPTKSSYFVGEKFNPKGLKVIEECYERCGFSRDVTNEVVFENTDKPLEAGTTSVTGKYGDKDIIISISVKEIVIVSIKAELKTDVKYFANGLAIPKASDFNVTATYNDNSTKTLTEDEFTVSAPVGFDMHGGTITISLKNVNNVKTEVVCTLEKVVLEKIEVKTNPANTTFRTGEAISLDGLVLSAVFNDGSTKDISNGYVCAEEGKTYNDERTVTAVVSYTDANNITKTVEITLTITDSDGEVTALTFEEGAIYSINAGEAFDIDNGSIPAVYAVYESGKKELLDSGEYVIALPDVNAVMGNKYFITATYSNNNKISVKLPVNVITKLNGDAYTDMAGGSVNSSKTTPEKEYTVGEDGTITETDRIVPWVGGFANAANAGKDAHVTWTITSSASAPANITFRAANSYLQKNDDGYRMDALQVNSVVDLYVNGEKIVIADSVVLKGCGPAAKYAPLYNIYYTFTIDGLILAKGNNEVMLVWKASTLGQKNCWNETPSTMNIDYIEVGTYGSDGDSASATAESIIVDRKTMAYGDDIAEYKTSYNRILGVMSDGTRKIYGKDEITISLTGDQSNDWFVAGEYTVTVALKDNAELYDSWTVTLEKIEEFYAYGASVEVKENKAYWVLIFACVNDEEYTAEDFTIFDGTNTVAVTYLERTAKYLYLYMDVTERAATGGFYVHAKIKNVNYDNGEGKNNGDFKETSTGGKITSTLVFPQTSVTLNGKTYSVKKLYNMAVFVIA